MATVAEVVGWVRSLANQGIGVDADGAYPSQCVDLSNMVSQKFFGRALRGNGIDMLNACRAAGYTSFTSGTVYAGAIFCASVVGHGYGHTGIVVGDMDGNGNFETVEQNVDGGIGGGPARYRVRNLRGSGGVNIIGWAYPPYTGGWGPSKSGQGSTQKVVEVPKWVPSKGETMDFIFNIQGDKNWNPNAQYFYNGAINAVQGIHNSEELKYIQTIYKETQDRDLKSYNWTPAAPAYARFFGVVQPSSSNADISKKLDEIKKALDNAT